MEWSTRVGPLCTPLALAALCLLLAATEARLAPARPASVLGTGRIELYERDFSRASHHRSLQKSRADRKLWRASKKGNVTAAEEALEEKADIEAKFGKSGRTPIMIAAFKGRLEVVELLIAAGADAKAYSDYGSNAVLMASQTNRVEVLKRLLWAGASPHASYLRRNVNTKKAANATAEGELERALINVGLDVENSEERGINALMEGAYRGHPLIVQTLLDFGADVNQESDRKAVALHVSGATIGRNSEKITRILLNAGAELEKRNVVGQTPFIFSAIFGNPGVAAILLEAGADASAKGHDGKGAADTICDCKSYTMQKLDVCPKNEIMSGCDKKKERKALKKLLSG